MALIGNKEMTLALSVGLVACQVPVDPWGVHLYLAASTWTFASLAVLNHLFPRRLAWLTHGVKGAYSHLLSASAGTGFAVGLAISLVDLLPLALVGRYRARDVAEGAGAAARLALIAIGFASIGFPLPLLALYLGCSALYFLERRARIGEGRRSDYRWPHHFEHLAIWIYLYGVNRSRLDISATHWALGCLVAGLAVTFILTVLTINATVAARWRRTLPAWFDRRVLEQFDEKVRGNLTSLKWYNHVLKWFDYAISSERMRWRTIEQMIDEIEVDERFDVAIGVFSGGAFIARYVCLRLGIERLYYVESKHWSGAGLVNTIGRIARYHVGRSIACRPLDEAALPDVRGQRVLLIDDTVTTGTTLEAVRHALRARGAVCIKTYALIVSDKHPPDYYRRVGPVPFIWPWGVEVD